MTQPKLIRRALHASALVAAMTAAVPASAQDIVAEALLPGTMWPTGEDIVALSSTDVVFLLPPGAERPGWLLERRGEDLSPVWSVAVEMPTPRGQGGIFDPATDWSSWHALFYTQEALLLFHIEGTDLVVRGVDPATGAMGSPREVAPPGSAKSSRARFASILLSGYRSHPTSVPFTASPSAQYFAVGVTQDDGQQSVRVLDADYQQVATYDVSGEGLYQVRAQIGDDGTLLLTGTDKQPEDLIFTRLPVDGDATVTLIDVGDKRVLRDVQVDTADGLVFVAALTGGPQARIDALQIYGVIEETGAVAFESRLTTSNLDDVLRKRQETFSGFDAFTRLVHLKSTPSGDVLIGLRPLSTVVGNDATTDADRFTGDPGKTLYRGGDLTLVTMDRDGEVIWGRTLRAEIESDIPFEIADRVAFTPELVRLALRRGASKEVPRLILEEYNLSNGDVGDTVDLVPDWSAGGAFLSPLTVAPTADDWMVAVQIPGLRKKDPDLTVLQRVDLRIDTPTGGIATPSASASLNDSEYVLGSARGRAAGYDSYWTHRLRGMGFGAGGMLLALMAQDNIKEQLGGRGKKEEALAVSTLLFAGGAGVAARLTFGNPPDSGWYTTRSSVWQAGYIQGYQESARRQSLWWSLVGGSPILAYALYDTFGR